MTTTAAEMVDVMDEGWRTARGADGLLAFFAPHLDPGVQMTGPLSPPLRGYAQVAEYFALLFAVVPDLHGRVAASTVVDDTRADVTMELRGTIGGTPVTLRLRDVLIVVDGRLVVRDARGLPVGMTLAILRHPRVWRAALALLARVRWSAPPRALAPAAAAVAERARG
jgi:hypothetical protein